MTKKKKDKQKPIKPKVNLQTGMPRPKPINLRGSSETLERAREFPLLGCWVMEGWQDAGLTPLVVARQMPEEEVLYAIFLVDIWCLGVKDALWKSGITTKSFYRQLPRFCSDVPEKCDPSLAYELVYGAIEFARKYEFEPHPDYQKASQILDPPEVYARGQGVKFGRDGKPYFIAGPNDNASAIITKLERTAGPGNFDYIVSF
jgi:hypothetical protein